MKTYSLIAASLATGLAATLAAPAVAGSLDQPVAEPVIAPAPVVRPAGGDWTGGYGGAALAFGDASAGAADGDGELYGLRAGYDHDFGSFVLGGGLDYDFASVNFAGGSSLDTVMRARVRAGVDLGQTLLYATGGVARADATIGGLSQSDTGMFGGIGADYRLSDSMTVGAEVLMHRFDDFNGTGTDIDATTAGLSVGFRF
jgi:opacity protein-like surface antigen